MQIIIVHFKSLASVTDEYMSRSTQFGLIKNKYTIYDMPRLRQHVTDTYTKSLYLKLAVSMGSGYINMHMLIHTYTYRCMYKFMRMNAGRNEQKYFIFS